MLQANVPSLFVDDLGRYPPEANHEQDQTREHGGEKAFDDSYGRHDLMGRCEPTP
jgi:hypothetical protein